MIFSLAIAVLPGLFLPADPAAAQLRPPGRGELLNAIQTIPHSRLRERAGPRILRYSARSSRQSVKDALRVLLDSERRNRARYMTAKKRIAGIEIDGLSADWQIPEFIHEDALNDAAALADGQPAGAAEESDDLKRWGLAAGKQYYYAFFEPAAMPEAGASYHYRINLFDDNWQMIYAIVWTSSGNAIQEWDGEGNFIRFLPADETVFARNQVFEARLPRGLLPRLSYVAGLQGVVWHDFKNLLDTSLALPGTVGLAERFRNFSFEILARYAVRGALSIDNPLPAALAITEGYLYRRAEPALRPKIINDGLDFLAEAQTSQGYSFPGQEKLAELDLEAILAWTNRLVIYGGYGSVDYYVARGRRFDEESYNFLALQPGALQQARELIESRGLLDESDLTATVQNIGLWLWSKIKYRRVNFSDIEEFYNAYPDDPLVQQIYQESLYEMEHHLTDITTVNGAAVNKGEIFSPTFQIPYLAENDIFYGNCVDVAAIAIAMYKALGIAAFPVAYGSVEEGAYDEYHTIAFYYSSPRERWLNFEWGAIPTPLLPDPLILAEINRPQIGTYWEFGDRDLGLVTRTLASRAAPQVHANSDWSNYYSQGYSAAQVREIILEAVS